MPFILILGLAGFASALSLRATDPLLPVLADDLGVTLREAALLASAYTLPYAIMQLVLGPVGDAIGKIRLIRISLAVLTVGLALSALAPGYGSVLAARALAGGFAGGVIPASMALIGDRVAYAERQFSISRFLVAVIFGQLSGSAISGALAEVAGWRAVFALSSVVAGLALAASLLFLHGERTRSELSLGGSIARYRTVLANPASLLVFATVAGEGILIFGVFPFVAPMLAPHGATGSLEAGIAISGFAVGGILYSLVVRRLVAGLGQWGMMRIGGAVAGLAYLLVAAPLPWTAVAGLFVVAGFGFYMLHNTMQTQATELAPGARGSALALFASSFFLGQGLGPILGGPISHAYGFGTLFVLSGLLTVGLGTGAAWLIKSR
ncbi:MFS transporter (plasmid) [Skermanella mucosa]|uniref:MFS transporter n=1 Tax=Skermanella mucosa TaxID=1789672 RepID=UPI00192B4D26|nr:MFS transporter [Skermanella mucosa]UEM25054.1 MFS transporter [Skermanella mucosa]